MSALLVTYDLKKPGQDYSNFLNRIRSYEWARLSESSYAIQTNEAPSAVYTEMRQHLNPNDNIDVVNLKRPYAGYGSQVVNEWLESRLSY